MTTEHPTSLWLTAEPAPRNRTQRFKSSLLPSAGQIAHLFSGWAEQFLSWKRPQPSFRPRIICSFFFFFGGKHLLSTCHVLGFCPVQEIQWWARQTHHPCFSQTQSLGWEMRNPAVLLQCDACLNRGMPGTGGALRGPPNLLIKGSSWRKGLLSFDFKEQRNSLGLGVNNQERKKVWGSESSGTLEEKQDFVRKFWFLTYEFPPQTF